MIRAYHLLDAAHAISDIALRRLKVSRFADLNDPFELLASDLSDKELRKVLPQWKSQIQKQRGLICFSRTWNNPVLWSHYADKHRGIALGFDLADHLANDVKYIRSRLKVNFQGGHVEAGLDEHFIEQLLLSKYVHWKYENEVRIFVGLDNTTEEHGLYFIPFTDEVQLAEVVVGPLCETPLEQVRQLVNDVAGYAKVTKARLAFTKFAVVTDKQHK